MWFWFVFALTFAIGLWAEPIAAISEKKSEPRPFFLKDTKARLQVEGAIFRPFRLWIDQEIKPDLDLAQKRLLMGLLPIVKNDLRISGGFSLVSEDPKLKGSFSKQNQVSDGFLRQIGAEGRAVLSLSMIGNQVKVQVELSNVMTQVKNQEPFSGSLSDMRKIAHQVSHFLFTNFIGPEDLFLSEIVAVKRVGVDGQLVMMDFDGHNERLLTNGSGSKAFPSFSPDGASVFFTWIQSSGHAIVEQNLSNNKQEFISRRKGLNMDPRCLPGNDGLLMTLSFGKNPDIYRTDRKGQNAVNLTRNSDMNLTPTIHPNGKFFAYVSTRSGNPQIYLQTLGANEADRKWPNPLAANRLTPQGNYNQTPQFSPDGSLIAFTGRDENNVFDVFLIELTEELKNKRVLRLTERQGRNQDPSFSLSGRYVLFVSERDGQSDIYLSNLNGAHQVRLTTQGGYLSPVVRPRKS